MFKPLLILMSMNVIWAGTYVAVKLGLGYMDPLTLIFWRMGISVAVLIFWIVVKRIPLRLNGKGALRMAALGTTIAVAHILWVTGLKYTTASDASLLYSFEPIWGVVLASIFLKEKFRAAMGIGLVFALVGLVILSDISLSTIGSLTGASVAFGNFLVVLGLFCECMFSIIAKPLSDRYSPIVVIAGALLVTELILSVPIAAAGSFSFAVNAKSIGILLFLSLPCTVVGYVLWVRLMRTLPVNVMCYTIFVQPVFGPIIAAVTIGEILSGRVFKGGAFLLAGLAIAIVSHVRAHRAEVCVSISQPATL